MVLLKQSKSFRLKDGAFSLFLFLLFDYCQAADGNSDSLEVMDLTLYLFLFFSFFFLMNTVKAQFSLKEERAVGFQSRADNEWICRGT